MDKAASRIRLHLLKDFRGGVENRVDRFLKIVKLCNKSHSYTVF